MEYIDEGEKCSCGRPLLQVKRYGGPTPGEFVAALFRRHGIDVDPVQLEDRAPVGSDGRHQDRAGRPESSIDDFLCFAAALEVPPWYLLVPDGLDAPMRVGNTAATAGAVGAWLVADWPFAVPRGGCGALAVGHGFTWPVSRGAGAASW